MTLVSACRRLISAQDLLRTLIEELEVIPLNRDSLAQTQQLIQDLNRVRLDLQALHPGVGVSV